MYKTSFTFTATPPTSVFVLMYNNTKQILATTGKNSIDIPVYSGSPCDCIRRFSISDETLEGETETGTYKIDIVQILPATGGGSVSASTWTVEDLILQPIGFLPFNCDNPPEEANSFSLYGWTGPHSNLWINDRVEYDEQYTGDFYTDTPNPTTTSKLYMKDGREIINIRGLNPGGGYDDWSPSNGIIIENNSIKITPT